MSSDSHFNRTDAQQAYLITCGILITFRFLIDLFQPRHWNGFRKIKSVGIVVPECRWLYSERLLWTFIVATFMFSALIVIFAVALSYREHVIVLPLGKPHLIENIDTNTTLSAVWFFLLDLMRVSHLCVDRLKS